MKIAPPNIQAPHPLSPGERAGSPYLATRPHGAGRVSAPTSQGFSDFLKVQDGATDRAPQSRQDQARQAATQLVANSFVIPILEQIRDDPFKSDLFHGGQAEDAFAGQLDTVLADRIAGRIAPPIVDAIYRRILVTAPGTQATPGSIHATA